MAESASTGNSGTGTSTTGTTSTSTSNSGAAPGSQSSSNGSFSTGKGSNNGGSNSGVGPGLSFGAGVGAANGPSIGLPSFNNGKAGFTGFASSNFGQGWGGTPTYTVSPGADGKHTVHPDANGKHTVYATTKSDRSGSTVKQLTVPFMTVDDVYGKGNQSMVESQGDYEASSNEKSNVETSTFGKQDEISVTPLSVTEDKGLVNNDAIQSVEGLDFQQKDKANQEVMEAKKSRDEAEAEDNANGMRNQLKAVAEKDAEDNNAFQVGEKNTFEEENNAKLNELNQQKQEVDAANKEVKDAEVAVKKAEAEEEAANAAYQKAKEETEQFVQETKELSDFLAKTNIEVEGKSLKDRFSLDGLKKAIDFTNDLFFKGDFVKSRDQLAELAKEKGIDIGDLSKDTSGNKTAKALETVKNAMEAREQEALDNQQKAQEAAKTARNHFTEVTNKQVELQAAYETAEKAYNTWKTEYWTVAEKTKAEEEAAAKKAEEAVTTEAPSYKDTIDAAKNEIINSKDLTDEQKSETLSVLGNVETATEAVEKASNDLAANPNDASIIATWYESTKTLDKALKDAKGNNVLENTNFNKTFTKAVSDAISKSKVTMPDGSTKNIAEFMTETVTRSPKLAKGLYEAKAEHYADKAKELEDNGEKGIRSAMYKTLAAIENAKSKMAMTWLGSKFTFADNQVRNQFNQLAKTDMRATYATYNNVLNDETGKYSEAEKAEAFDAIQQANSLMTASAALQASTGFFSGIGDGTSDGVYGVTNPDDLNGYQEALNTASNFAKIALGLGVTPGANEAYQNMYYMAGAKVKQSGLFGRDFDGDGFALCQEYGNNAAVGMIAGAGELAAAVALMFNPATSKMGINLAIDAVQTFFDGLYGVQKEVNKSIKYSSEVLSYFKEAESIAAETGNKEAINAMSTTMDNAVKQIEDFQLKSDEVGNLDNWLEGSGSNTADNGKFNQALSYDEWLKLIEADPVMQEYAKSLNR